MARFFPPLPLAYLAGQEETSEPRRAQHPLEGSSVSRPERGFLEAQNVTLLCFSKAMKRSPSARSASDIAGNESYHFLSPKSGKVLGYLLQKTLPVAPAE